jgi:hypothetical protein
MIHSIKNIWQNGSHVGIEIQCYKFNQLVTVQIYNSDAEGWFWDETRLNNYRDLVQEAIDDRYPRSELPDGDPAKTTDPAEPGYFWDVDDIVTRSAIVNGVTRLDDKLIVSVSSPHG